MKNKGLLAGILLGVLLVYLSLGELDLPSVLEGFQRIRFTYVAIALFTLLVMQVLRSYRWGVLLSPIEKVDQVSLFSVTCVGYMLIVAIPARIGEFARPYLITRKSKIKMASALGSIVLERAFDFLTIMMLFPIVMFLAPIPPWLSNSAIPLLLAVITMFGLLILLIVKRDVSMGFMRAFLKRLPDKFSQRLEGVIAHFIDGFKVIESPMLFIYIVFLSLLIWLAHVLSIYAFFFALGLDLSLVAALTTMVVLIFGLTVPTAPGFVGNWHYFTMLALVLFGISRSDAMTFAIVHHAICITFTAILGLICLPLNTLTFSDLKGNLN